MSELVIHRKKIKHAYVRVRADGSVEMSVPMRMSQTRIDEIIAEKKSWIKKQQQKFASRPAVTEKKYVSGEQFSVFGQLCELQLEEHALKKHKVTLQNDVLQMYVPSESTREQREACLNMFYKKSLLEKVPALLEKWQPIIDRQVTEYRVRDMKTRWGTCNIQKQRVWLSLALAKYPDICLEYILVHEMTHLHERLHNKRFYALMDTFMPQWREHEQLLRSVQAQ